MHGAGTGKHANGSNFSQPSGPSVTRQIKYQRWTGLFLILLAGCLPPRGNTVQIEQNSGNGNAATETDAEGQPFEKMNANREILDEINSAKGWFRAKKVKPIWAKPVDELGQVDTIEGIETIRPGDYLCRGVENEQWPQAADKLKEKYDATDEVDADGWRRYLPKPDNHGVLAAQVNHPFTVHASWGVLSGKPGDFIVKSYADRDTEYPDDVWIVDKKLFGATYERTR